MSTISILKLINESPEQKKVYRGRNFKTLAKLIDSLNLRGIEISTPGKNGVGVEYRKNYETSEEMAKAAINRMREDGAHLGEILGWIAKPSSWSGFIELSAKLSPADQEKADQEQRDMVDALTSYYQTSRYTGD